MSHSKLAQRPHWLITKHKISQLEVLTIDSDDGQALPVFSFEDEARMFLHFHYAGAQGDSWTVRETSVGELTSMLFGPCAGVKEVALDPPPEVCGGPLLGLLSMERSEFVRVLLEDQSSTPHPIEDGIGRFAHPRVARRTTHYMAVE